MKIGIKQFSNKLEYYREDLIEFWEKQLFDYIELYIFPDSLEYLNSWSMLKKNYGIEFTIHAPHNSQGVNLADESKLDFNKSIYNQINTFAKALDAEYTVVHGGMDGNIKEVLRQIQIVNPFKMRIENKPFVAPRNPDTMVCRGATVDEIKFILNNYDCGFNLDIGHAFCSAVSQGINQIELLKQFLELNPASYHLSDGLYNDRIDIHYHLKAGDYNWDEIFPLLDKSKNWTLETITKEDTDGLKLVKNDIDILKSLI